MVYPNLMFPLFFCRLFDWIVDFINSSIKAPEELKHSFIGNNEIIVSFSFLILFLEKQMIKNVSSKQTLPIAT